MITSKPIWIDDSEGHEEGGYWQAETTIRCKKIKIECWKEKPKFDGDFGCELRHVIAEDGQYYWCIPLGQYPFWPDASFD